MKIVSTSPLRALTTIALIAYTTLAFAGPVTPVPQPPPGSTKFGSININEQFAGPVTPVPQPPPGSTRFGSSSLEIQA